MENIVGNEIVRFDECSAASLNATITTRYVGMPPESNCVSEPRTLMELLVFLDKCVRMHVLVRVRACGSMCVCACVYVRVFAHACASVCLCVLAFVSCITCGPMKSLCAV